MKKGFTLIELLATIIVLGILVLITVPVANNVTRRSARKTITTTAKETLKAAESYFVENGKTEGKCATISDLDMDIKDKSLSGQVCVNENTLVLSMENNMFIVNGTLDHLEIEDK